MRTIYTVEYAQAQAGVAAIGGELDATYSRMDALNGVLSRLVAGFLGFRAVQAAVGFIRQGVVGLNQDAENTTNTIAGMLSAAGVGSFAQSMGLAADVLQQIRRDSAALPGEAQDYITVYRSALTSALDSGMRAADVEGFTNRFAAVGSAFNIDSAQLGRDLSLLLQGRAGAQVRSWNDFLRPRIGMDAHAFNALGAPERQRRIADALRAYQPMLDAAAHTWAAISGTTHQHITDLQRTVSAPLFDHIKGSLDEINQWFDAHETQLLGVADALGGALADGFDRALNAALRFGHRLEALADSPATRILVALGDRLAGAVQGAAANPGAAAGLAAGAVGAVAGLNPAEALLLGGAIRGLTDHTWALDMVFASLSSAGDYLLGLWDALSATIDYVQGLIGDTFANVIAAVQPGFDELVASISTVGRILIDLVSDVVHEAGPAIGVFVEHLGALLGALAEMLGPVIRILGTALAALARLVINNLMSGFVTFINTLSAVLARITSWLHMSFQGFAVAADRLGATVIPGADHGTDTLMDRFNTMMTRLAHPTANAQGVNANGQPQHHHAAAPHQTNVHVRIEQTINDASDPDRVMVDTRRAFWQALWSPIETPTNRVLR